MARLTPRQVAERELARVASDLGLPNDALCIIENKNGNGVVDYKVYIKVIGLYWLCQKDDRGINSIRSICLVDALLGKGHAKYRGHVSFKDGSFFEQDGNCCYGDLEKGGRKITTTTLNDMAETRAMARTMRAATANALINHQELGLEGYEGGGQHNEEIQD